MYGMLVFCESCINSRLRAIPSLIIIIWIISYLTTMSGALCIISSPQKSEVPPDYDKHDPEQKQIYRFVRTLFSAAQLTAECAIVTLVSVRTCQRVYV